MCPVLLTLNFFFFFNKGCNNAIEKIPMAGLWPGISKGRLHELNFNSYNSKFKQNIDLSSAYLFSGRGFKPLEPPGYGCERYIQKHKFKMNLQCYGKNVLSPLSFLITIIFLLNTK